MTGLLAGLKSSARSLARAVALSAVFAVAGLILALVGLGCLTAALWIAIALHEGTIFAFAFVGIIYIALAAIFLALAAYAPRNLGGRATRARGRHDDQDNARPPREPLVQMAEGFAMGMRAGRAARGSRR